MDSRSFKGQFFDQGSDRSRLIYPGHRGLGKPLQYVVWFRCLSLNAFDQLYLFKLEKPLLRPNHHYQRFFFVHPQMLPLMKLRAASRTVTEVLRNGVMG